MFRKTLILLSANKPKIVADIPGLSSIPDKVILDSFLL